VRRGKAFSAGRAVALRALSEPDPDTDYLTTKDRRVTAFISSQRTWSGGREFYFSPRAPLSLVDHPRATVRLAEHDMRGFERTLEPPVAALHDESELTPARAHRGEVRRRYGVAYRCRSTPLEAAVLPGRLSHLR
jgi:hypothetical protein